GVFAESGKLNSRELPDLQLLVEIACGAGDIHSTRRTAFPVLHALYNARRLRALRTIRALGGIHLFLAIPGFGNLGHTSILLAFSDRIFQTSIHTLSLRYPYRKLVPD